MNFIQQLFGKKAADAPSKKGWLSIAVHCPTSRILAYCRGPLNHIAHWGEVGFLLEQRLEECRKHYDFVPDEVIIGFIVENIEKVPVLDKAKPEPFERFIKGLKEQKRVSLREYQYRKESNLKDSDVLPTQYQTWVALQNSRELANRHATDLKEFKQQLEQQPVNTDILINLMTSYLSDSLLFGKFIEAMTQMEGLAKRIELYTKLESLIENSKLYKNSRVEEMDYFLMLPPDQMEPIHVLACETLRDALRKECDGRLFGVPMAKLMSQGSYDRICKMMIDYHTYKKMPLDPIDEEYTMKHHYAQDMNGLVSATRAVGLYDESDSDAYPGMGAGVSPDTSLPKVPVNMGNLDDEEPAGQTSTQQAVERPAVMHPEPIAFPAVTPLAAPVQADHEPIPAPQSAPVAAQQPEVAMEPIIDVEAEAAMSIQRLSAGALLRDEVYRWREYTAITQRQLEWAFAQPYITAEKLIQNGTLHGAILKTRYFMELVTTVANAEDDISSLSLTDRNVLLAYGKSMDHTYDEYEMMLSMVKEGSAEYVGINRQKASLLAEYGQVKSKVLLLRKDEQRRLMHKAIEHASLWAEHFFDGSAYPLLSDEGFFQQFDEYQQEPAFLLAVLPKIEALALRPKEQRKRSIGELIQKLDYYGSINRRSGDATYIPYGESTALSAEQCTWEQVFYLLCFYLQERDRLLQETQPDIHGVCEMVQLHMRLGRKLPGWMLQSLYWVIDMEIQVNRYGEQLKTAYRYAIESYQAVDKTEIQPYPWTAENARFQCRSLAAALAEWGNRFTRWYNAEEVWNWYCQGDAVPNGFVPSDEAEYAHRKKSKKGNKGGEEVPAKPAQTQAEAAEHTPTETVVKEDTAINQPKNQPVPEEQKLSTLIPPVTQEALPAHEEGKPAEAEKLPVKSVDELTDKKADPVDNVPGSNYIEEQDPLDSLGSDVSFADEFGHHPNDLENYSGTAADNVKEPNIEDINANMAGNSPTEPLTREDTITLFQLIADENLQEYDQEQQSLFEEDVDAIVADNCQFTQWNWNSGRTYSQLGVEVCEYIDRKLADAEADLDECVDLIMALLIVDIAHLPLFMWAIHEQCSKQKFGVLPKVIQVWEEMASEIKRDYPSEVTDIFVQQLEQRANYLSSCWSEIHSSGKE